MESAVLETLGIYMLLMFSFSSDIKCIDMCALWIILENSKKEKQKQNKQKLVSNEADH